MDIWFQRLSYVGELGWELYIAIKESKKIYEMIHDVGKNHNLVHAGRLAMDIMRMEKGYLHWGHDITPAENPFEAGLGFAVHLNKKEDFIGKQALLKIRQKPLKKQLIKLTLDDSIPGKPLLLHDEPIYSDGKIVGETTSGNYSFNFKKNMSFGYINLPDTKEELKQKKFQIEVAKIKYNATLQLTALHDPKNVLIRN